MNKKKLKVEVNIKELEYRIESLRKIICKIDDSDKAIGLLEVKIVYDYLKELRLQLGPMKNED